MKPSYYQNSKAVFCKAYEPYFAKALIQGFTMDMSLSFYSGSKAVICQVYEPLLC